MIKEGRMVVQRAWGIVPMHGAWCMMYCERCMGKQIRKVQGGGIHRKMLVITQKQRGVEN